MLRVAKHLRFAETGRLSGRMLIRATHCSRSRCQTGGLKADPSGETYS